MDPSYLLIGFGAGTLATTAAAWAIIRRHLRRVRLAERRARHAERMAEIGAMTGGLAHEIKNPLSTIGLNAQLLVEGIQELDIPPGERSPLLNRTKALQRETDRLRGILQDFLDFAGQVHLERRPTDINQIVADLADFYHPEAESHGVSIKTDLAPGPITLSIDPRAVKQAVLNLLINATQAMAGARQGSGPRTVFLRTRLDKDPDAGAPASRVASIHVIDTGPGIDRETLSQIFKPYFTTKGGGSGLGLPTSRRLIEEHGGRITVKSEPGRGSDFAVVLPVE
ncbi:MAG TPA: ATP-binding protein [Phycisphaerales bacterium]|nr:ATP-binding protein [Phycisphaerales bacterium]